MPSLHIKKSISIAAPIEKVFGIVQDFHTWRAWSPWLCVEKEAMTKITGSGTEVGDVSYWRGEVIGEGEMEHSKITPNKSIEQQLRFIKPYTSTSFIHFDFKKEGEGTRLTWSMDGSLPFFLFFLRKMMVAMIGNDFNRGLGMLKSYAETGEVPTDTEIGGIVTVQGSTYVSISRETSMEDMEPEMSQLFPVMMGKLQEKGVSPVGLPMSMYQKWDMVGGRVRWSAAVPVQDGLAWEDGEMSKHTRGVTKAFKVTHTGDYAYLGNAWAAAMQHVQAKKMKQRKDMVPFEVYINDPISTPAGELKTEIYIPLR